MRIVSEPEFRVSLEMALDDLHDVDRIGSVTGPGRSGAVAAVYASHYLGVPFVPYGQKAPTHLGDVLVVDTARQSGRTLRRAAAKYGTKRVLSVFEEPPRVKFWYEKITD